MGASSIHPNDMVTYLLVWIYLLTGMGVCVVPKYVGVVIICNIVMNLINALPGNSSVNTVNV
jgi:hypothetical protein